VLRLILFKPVTKFMEARSAKVRDALEQSEKERNQAKALLTQYETHLKNVEAEAAEILRASRENARAEAEKILAEGKSRAENLVSGARKQIEAERAAAMADFRREAVLLVTAVSGRLTGREFNSADNRHYVRMLLDEIGGN
jgi:F-type H+-transporting ATPase subunit b